MLQTRQTNGLGAACEKTIRASPPDIPIDLANHSPIGIVHRIFNRSLNQICPRADAFCSHTRAGSIPSETADFCIAGGIFNVKLDVDEALWERYVFEMIDTMARTTRRGFSFNCLTDRADASHKESRLYYASLGRMLDHCLERFGRSAGILHDYGLYEFTVLVRNGSPLGFERQA